MPAAVLGIPQDENSSYLRGAAGGPAGIRRALHSGSGNWCCENGHDLEQDDRWRDQGDLDLAQVGPDGASRFTHINRQVDGILKDGARLLCLGGDHSITFPIVQAVARHFTGLNILHLDAHPDLYDDFQGNPLSHASPFARILQAGLAKRLVQVGCRTMTPQQRRIADRFGVEVIELRAWRPELRFAFDGPVYISLDLDVLDPAFAPGVSHHEPGGFSTREVLGILQGLRAEVVGADIVEFNPTRDVGEMTAMVGAKFYKELLVKILERIPSGGENATG